MDTTTHIANTFFSSLPDDIQKVIVGSAWRQTLVGISERYRLSAQQSAILERETLLVFLALAHPQDYTQNLMTNLPVILQVAQQINEEVKRNVFGKMYDTLGEIVDEIDSLPAIPVPPQSVTAANPSIPPAPIVPIRQPVPQPQTTPTNLPTVPEHHDLMKYYAGTEPIMPEQIDYSGPVPLKKKDSPTPPKLADTPRYQPPRYIPGTDPYREPSQ